MAAADFSSLSLCFFIRNTLPPFRLRLQLQLEQQWQRVPLPPSRPSTLSTSSSSSSAISSRLTLRVVDGGQTYAKDASSFQRFTKLTIIILYVVTRHLHMRHSSLQDTFPTFHRKNGLQAQAQTQAGTIALVLTRKWLQTLAPSQIRTVSFLLQIARFLTSQPTPTPTPHIAYVVTTRIRERLVLLIYIVYVAYEKKKL
jgi:hypothetical protein